MNKATAAHTSTTQQFLDIYDVTNDIIILNDGAASLVITVSAMNFGLLSEEEQDATIYAYAALLNSLSFPIEIVIRSQPKDVTAYLKLIANKEDETVNPVYKQRIREYRSFVESLVQEQNVLDKKFYIAIPLTAFEMGLTTPSVIPGAKGKSLSTFDKTVVIDKARTNLIPRRDHLIDQLARIGLYSRQLTTPELIQMLYSSYNPEAVEGQQITDTSNYTTPLVQAQIQGDRSMTDQTLTSTPAPMAPSMASAPVMDVPTPSTAPSMPTSPSPMATPPTPASNSILEPVGGITTPPSMSMPPVSTPVAPMPTPVVTPPTPMSVPPAPAGVDNPQSLINQSLSQIGVPAATPVAPTPSIAQTPAMPAADEPAV